MSGGVIGYNESSGGRMKYLMLALVTSFLWIGQPALSDEEVKCTCDHKCTEACEKGEGSKTCDCKACECSKTGNCSHHKCGGHDEKKEKPKK
jgi:hypothetical protein